MNYKKYIDGLMWEKQRLLESHSDIIYWQKEDFSMIDAYADEYARMFAKSILKPPVIYSANNLFYHRLCYFCFLLEKRGIFNTCDDCPYGQKYGRCSIDPDSAWKEVCQLMDRKQSPECRIDWLSHFTLRKDLSIDWIDDPVGRPKLSAQKV